MSRINLKVLINATPWYEVPPKTYGGIESFCGNLARGLSLLGCEVTTVSPGQLNLENLKPSLRHRRSLDAPATKQFGEIEPELEHLLALREAIKDHDYDVIHDNTIFGSNIGLAAGIPTILTIHRIIQGDYRRIYERLANDLSLVAISRRQRELAPNIHVSRIIHHGIDTDYYLPTSTPTRDYLLFLGSMNYHKGAHHAIEVAKKLKFKLVIAAKCEQQHEIDYFTKYIHPKLSKDIVFLGEVGGAQKVSLLQNAFALIFPALWEESFGLVMTEALACDTPVVGYKIGAAPEIIRHGSTGFLAHDLDSLTQAVTRVPALPKHLCRQSAIQEFDYRLMAKKYLDLCHDIIYCQKSEDTA